MGRLGRSNSLYLPQTGRVGSQLVFVLQRERPVRQLYGTLKSFELQRINKSVSSDSSDEPVFAFEVGQQLKTNTKFISSRSIVIVIFVNKIQIQLIEVPYNF